MLTKNQKIGIGIVCLLVVSYIIYLNMKITEVNKNHDALTEKYNELEKNSTSKIKMLENVSADIKNEERVIGVGHELIKAYIGNYPLAQKEKIVKELSTVEIQKRILSLNPEHEEKYNAAYKPSIEFVENNLSWLNMNKTNLSTKVKLSANQGSIKVYYEYKINLELTRNQGKWIVSKLDLEVLNAPASEGGGH